MDIRNPSRPSNVAVGKSEPSDLDKDAIKVFTLAYADAASMVKVLSDILDDTKTPGRTNLRMTVDERNNNIIARGDLKTIQIAEVLLMRLDGVSIRGSSGKPSVPPSPYGTTSSKPIEQKPLSFRTAKITCGDIAATISATGTIEPEEVVDVTRK